MPTITLEADVLADLCEQAFNTGYREAIASFRNLKLPAPEMGDWLRDRVVKVARELAEEER